MKNSFISKLPAVAIAAVLMHSTSASAVAIGIDPSGNGAYTTYSDLWTNNTDSALVVGFQPNTLIPPSAAYDIRLVSQARVGILNSGANNVTPLGMNPSFGTTAATCAGLPDGCFELTKVLDIQERVIANDGTNANFGNTVQLADVDLGTPGLQQLAIYLDPLAAGNAANRAIPGNGAGTVSGYNDGILILSASIVGNSSSFASSGNIGTGSFDLRFKIDYVNPLYLDVALGNIIGDKLTGTTNIPTQFTPANMWDGTLTNTGLLLKVDSSENFIPEPSILALLGLGLIGFGFTRRRT